MAPYVDDPDFTLHVGDVADVLAELPDQSVHCVVTSPPYWGLRDYGTTGQLGLEATPDEYVARMVAVFREVRRVLRDDGTLWLNLGDSYVGSWGNQGRKDERGTQRPINGDMLTPVHDGRYPDAGTRTGSWVNDHPTLKPKDLVGIPWRVAFALQADGWYLRADIVWSKPNPMPESVTDRPTKAHEYLFLLTKRPRYYFDQEAVREQYEARPQQRLTASKDQPLAGARIAAGVQQGDPQGGTHINRFAVQTEKLPCLYPLEDGRRCLECDTCHVETPRGPDGRRNTHIQGADGSIQHRDGERWPNAGRNVRSVWEIATQPYPDAHFATFPEELPRRCIAAGTSEHGVCPECGAPWERVVDVGRLEPAPPSGNREIGRWTGGESDIGGRTRSYTVGWRPTCSRVCLTAYKGGSIVLPPVPATVLDPFAGSGTTNHVARKLGRRSIGIELNHEYAQLAARRMQQLSLLA